MAEIYPLRDAKIESSSNNVAFQKQNKVAEKLAKSCECADMPSIDHLSKSDYNKVYEPSDDTFLLLDALNIDFGPGIRPNEEQCLTTLEIGVGTGVATVFLAQQLAKANQKALHYVTDINPDAIDITLKTAKQNQIPKTNDGEAREFEINAIQCDLASELLPDQTGKIDVLIFNPPYVPTPDDEVGGTGIEASWAGGENGRIVVDKALPQIAQLLSWPNGVAYMVTVDENFPEEIADLMKRKYGILVTPFVRRKAWNEYLSIQKMTLTKELHFEGDKIIDESP